jgi:anti-sigma factor RsiW
MTPPPIDCLHVVHQMWDYLDKELPAERWEEVRAHLATCTGCREHVEFCRSFLERIRDVPVEELEVAALRERVRGALQSEALRER